MTNKERYICALNGLGIEYKESIRKTMSRILRKKRFHEIVDMYNY